MLTRLFKKARDASGYFDHLRPEQRPTFHELRGLGGDLYRKAGWLESEIQRLMGHSTVTMTKGYLADHEHWERVFPGLDNGKEVGK